MKENSIKVYGQMRRQMSDYNEYEKPEDWDELSIKERLDHIYERLQFISTRDRYKDMRRRFASEQQYDEEFGPASGYEELISELWFSAKEDYARYKEQYDTYLELNPQSKGYMNNIEAMRKVIDEELDNILLDTETDSNNTKNEEGL